MTNICYPPGTDWGCAYTPEQLSVMWSDPVTAGQMERSEALAWMQLAALTADQIGTCPIVVRPCNQACAGGSASYLSAPVGLSGHYAGATTRIGSFTPHVNSGGNWVNSCGCASGDCSCSALCEAILPGPVGDILEVKLDGAVLDPTAYRVDNGNRLVRTDGECWPACQDMSKPGTPQYEPIVVENVQATYTFTRDGEWVQVDMVAKGVGGFYSVPAPYSVHGYTQVGIDGGGWMTAHGPADSTTTPDQVNTVDISGPPTTPPTTLFYLTDDPAAPNDAEGTFFVTYYRGAAPDQLSLWMAGLLAVEYYKACTADKSCRLPNRLQSVARQGVTYNVAFEDDGTTGIREVDDYVRRLNPYHLKMGPVVVSPQSRRTRTTTWSR